MLDLLTTLIDKGGPLMVAILAVSLLGTVIVVERLLFVIRVRENAAQVFDRVADLLRAGRAGQALDYCQASRGPLARTLGAGVTQFGRERSRLEETLEVAAQEQIAKLERRLRALEVMASIAPLLGLLGTVMGMVESFRRVARVEGAVDPALLAGGIWEALLTTAAGLTVAIPLLVCFNYFDRRREKLTMQLEKFAALFVHLRDDLAAQRRASRPGRQVG